MSRRPWFALALVLLLLGRGWSIGRQLLAPLPEETDRLLVVACVQSIPAVRDDGWQFDARVRFLQQDSWPPRRLRLQLPEGLPAPTVGDCWQYAARLSQPRTPSGRRALLRDHFSGYARVDAGPLNRKVSAGDPGTLLSLRARLERRIAGQVADPSAAALLAALAVGATGEVSPRQWQVFNATGITHLVAISGMHVTFFAMLAMGVARRVWQWLAPRAWLPRRSLCASLVGIAMALAYALLAGMPVPAQRTVLMLAAFLGVRECSRCAPPSVTVGMALVAVLAWDPMAVLDAGFWLSFLAVGAIVFVQGSRLAQPSPRVQALALQWVVGIALLPVTVAIFGTFPAAGLLVNLLAIPLFSVLLVPPILLATACLLLPLPALQWCGEHLMQAVGWLATLMWPWLSAAADLPGALWRASVPWTWYLLAMPAALLVLLPVSMRLRLAAAALLGSVFLLRAPRPPPGELWLDVRASASTTALVLRTRSHLVLLGTGEVHGSGGEVFARRLLPLLREAGYPVIDLWLPGSLTRDVQAALRLAAAEFPVRAVLLPVAIAPPPEMQGCRDMRWQWDGIEFQLQQRGDGRARACTLSVARGTHLVSPLDLGALAIDAGGAVTYVLDDAGLALRSMRLRL